MHHGGIKEKNDGILQLGNITVKSHMQVYTVKVGRNFSIHNYTKILAQFEF